MADLEHPREHPRPRSSTRAGSTSRSQRSGQERLHENSTWYKDAVVYQLHVRAYADSNGDGIGDFQGLISKLDYIADLGVSAVWLLPFYPSPLRDDGYDIADYFDIHASYGSLRDFKEFLKEAHRRKIKVITELVINHTSEAHEWFQKSRRAAPGSYWRNFYVWNDSPEKYKEARIIFKDFEASNWTWDPVAGAYYWHRFYSHQPDLNFDNPEVQKSILRVMDYWLDMGVDGLRLDAVPYLFEREGTSCENLPETHAYLKSLRGHIDSKYPGRMLLAEANQWPEDAVAYFGNGDECHMAFHFPLMPRLFMALRMEDRYSVIDILKQTPAIPDNCQWAIFLRNHDELTLEMVTDEERDYMQRMYASDPRARINLGIRRRLSPLVGNDRRQVELLNALLFSMPGTPIIYYGDEIGMGDNIYLGDRNGVRTPFQWSPDRNAGFSKANPQSLFLPVIDSPEYHYEALNVETQQSNPNSLLWWMKRMIAIRKLFPELSAGQFEMVDSNNPKVLAYLRKNEKRTLLVVANLSRRVQPAELILAKYRGRVPRELFGGSNFPAVGEQPYFVTLGPFGFYWFELQERQGIEAGQWLLRNPSMLQLASEPLRALADPDIWRSLEGEFREYVTRSRWFRSRGRVIDSVGLEDLFFMRLYERSDEAALALIRISFSVGDPEMYFIMVGHAEGERAERVRAERPDLVIGSYVRFSEAGGRQEGIYFDAIVEPGLSQAVLDAAFRRRVIVGKRGSIYPELFLPVRKEWQRQIPVPSLAAFGRNNSALAFGKQFHMKFYRRIEEGENPETEIGQALVGQEKQTIPTMLGSLTYVANRKRYSIGILEQYVAHEMNMWDMVLDHLSHLAEIALAGETAGGLLAHPIPESPWVLLDKAVPESMSEVVGPGLSLMELLGKRTAELHQSLAQVEARSEFMPEPFTPFYQRSLYQSFRNLVDQTMAELKIALPTLEGKRRELAEGVLAGGAILMTRFAVMKERRFDVHRIRIHGDFHLAQVLFTGRDFVIVDLEGEPERPLGERRLKKTALRDVGSLLRSIELATLVYLKERVLRDEDREKLRPAFVAWKTWASAAYLRGYLAEMRDPRIIPKSREAMAVLVDLFSLEKGLHEVRFESSKRSDWLDIVLWDMWLAIHGRELKNN